MRGLGACLQYAGHVPAAEHGRSSGAENPGLLARDRLGSRAQKLLMIEPDAHHHGDRRIDDVDGVQATTHADFEHPGVEPRRLEHEKSAKRVVLEKSERDRTARAIGTSPARLLDTLESRNERARLDLRVLHPDSLAIIPQVRRGERAHTIARSLQNSGGIGCDGALAVGARDGDDGQSWLPPAEALEHGPQPLEPKVDRLRVHPFLVGEPLLEAAH